MVEVVGWVSVDVSVVDTITVTVDELPPEGYLVIVVEDVTTAVVVLVC